MRTWLMRASQCPALLRERAAEAMAAEEELPVEEPERKVKDAQELREREEMMRELREDSEVLEAVLAEADILADPDLLVNFSPLQKEESRSEPAVVKKEEEVSEVAVVVVVDLDLLTEKMVTIDLLAQTVPSRARLVVAIEDLVELPAAAPDQPEVVHLSEI